MSRYTHPLAHGLFSVFDREADGYKGRCGGKTPLRWVPEDAKRLEQGGNILPLIEHLSFATVLFEADNFARRQSVE